MDIKHLRTVVAVAEAGSITKAAKILYIAQPALSTQLQQLESILGVELFARTPKGVQLTEAGEKFLIHAKAILKYTEHAVEEMKTNGTNDMSGLINIGCVNSLTTTVGATLLKSLKYRYPKLLVSIQTLGGSALQHSAVSAELDFYVHILAVNLKKDDGTTVLRIDNPMALGAQHKKIATEKFLLCLPQSGVSDAGRRDRMIGHELPPQILETAPICLFNKDHAVMKLIDWLVAEHDLEISHYGYSNNTEVLIDLVSAEQCIALLPSSITELSFRRPHISLHSLRGYHIEREIGLCYADDLVVSETIRVVMEQAEEVLLNALSD